LVLGAVTAVSVHVQRRDEAKPNVLLAYPGAGRGTAVGTVGRTMYMAAYVYPDVNLGHHVLDISRIAPVIPVNSAHATVVVGRCIRTASDSPVILV
jgi:hypothetical protein